MVGSLVVESRKPDVARLTTLHGPEDNFVVFMEARVFHFKLLINFTSLWEIHKLAVVMASLVTVVNIVSVLDFGPFAFNQNKFHYGVFVNR